MSVPPDHDFEDLRKLLAWKRHEQPPPGYFHLFSARVLERIEREQMCPTSTWWERFVQHFDAKPVFACAYAVAISSLLLVGFRFSQMFDNDTASVPPSSAPWLATTPAPGSALSASFGNAAEPPPSAYGSFQSALRAETPNLFFPSHNSAFHAVRFRPAD